MKASISFLELQNLIAENAKQAISFSYVDEKTFRVTYPLDLGFFKKDISADLIIKELTDGDLLMQLSAGLGSDKMLTTVLSLFKNKIPEGLIEKLPDSHLLLHLGEIEKMKSLFEKVDIRNLHVISEGLEVEGLLK